MPHAFLGAVAMLLVLSLWSWWAEVNAAVSWRAFWLPVRDTTMHGKPWMKVHLVAHLIGGIAIALFLLGPWFSAAWAGAVWQRFLWILVAQLWWERIQHENWRNGAGSSDYPWWSFVWDVQITLAGWAVVECLRWAL